MEVGAQCVPPEEPTTSSPRVAVVAAVTQAMVVQEEVQLARTATAVGAVALQVKVELKLPEDKALNVGPVKTDKLELVEMRGVVAAVGLQAAAAAVGLAAAEPTTTVVVAAALAMPTPT